MRERRGESSELIEWLGSNSWPIGATALCQI